MRKRNVSEHVLPHTKDCQAMGLWACGFGPVPSQVDNVGRMICKTGRSWKREYVGTVGETFLSRWKMLRLSRHVLVK